MHVFCPKKKKSDWSYRTYDEKNITEKIKSTKIELFGPLYTYEDGSLQYDRKSNNK